MQVKGKVVAVIGGGETGNDCVEAALNAGAREVHQLEVLPKPASGDDLPSGDEPSPVHRRWSVAVREFVGDGSLSGLRAVEVRWLGSTKGKIMKELPGGEFSVKADLAVLAVGFDPVVDVQIAQQLGLELLEGGRPVVDDFASSVDGVFVAGDLATGASLVARAIATGRRVAAKIDRHLARSQVHA